MARRKLSSRVRRRLQFGLVVASLLLLLAALITVAVLDLKATAGNEGAARALTTLITNEIGSRKGWREIGRAHV